MQETIRVFAVLGDAALRRQMQQQWRGNGLVLCGMHAESGDSLVEEIARVRPDVAVIDVETDGAKALVQLAAARLRVPVVGVVRTQQSGFGAVRPLEWGAVTLVPRETDGDRAGDLEAAVREAATAQVVDVLENHFPLSGAFPDAAVFDMRRALQEQTPDAKVLVLGAGIGGPAAIRRILHEIKSATVSPIVIAQRIPEPLMHAFVPWLEHHTGATVVRATTGPLEIDTVYVAGSGCEVRVESHSGTPTLCVTPCEDSVTPSFDTLFATAARTYGERAIAMVLTGTGTDGSEGLQAVRRAGGLTIVQDRMSSIHFAAAANARAGGGAIECLPINEIAERIVMLMRSAHPSRS